jgi:(1->4)-alpha-D-glucan 1-alpha-D-glucosylmutase
MTPRATYRLQFNSRFTFADGARLASYLGRMGISHVYSSPIATARKGSPHGYDGTDPTTINPELGGAEGFATMAKALRAEGVGIILDIVPNHLCVADPANAWWQDVLENGQRSAFARYFDIDWRNDDPRLEGKVFLPILGEPYEKALRSGAIKLICENGRTGFAYHQHRFPLRPEDRRHVGVGAGAPDLSRWQAAEALDELLTQQNFVLGWWRTAGDRINWRRFFDINELAALRVEEPAVFDAVHALPLSLYRRGLIDGVRVDHIDGLADPAAYCRKLRARFADARLERPPLPSDGPAYIIIEKILAMDEVLPAGWEIDGTTGYDFLAEVSALQHNPLGKEPLQQLWSELSERSPAFDPEETAGRRKVLPAFMRQLGATADAFARAAKDLPSANDVSRLSLRRAIAALVDNLRIYRTYATADGSLPLPEQFEHARARASAHLAQPDCAALDFIARVLAGTSEADQTAAADAARRLNQLSSAIAAKGVEDTAFYRYGVLLSRNDVGSDPAIFSLSPLEFHVRCQERAQSLPHALLATATHDHKRGEDARARLAALSERPDEWSDCVAKWLALSDDIRPKAVSFGDAYQLFQTVIGSWPAILAIDDHQALAKFRDRILGWRMKSLREAKLQTSWTAVDEAFETAHTDFVRAMFDPQRSLALLNSLQAFVDIIAPAGAANGLAQALVKLTVPGVPDFYQGREFWDFSLVDPDNRAAVDFPARERALDTATFAKLAATWRDGRIKQAMIATLLQHRALDPELYSAGQYVPLATEGARKDHIVAFARVRDRRFLLVAVARCCAPAISTESLALDPAWWTDTSIRLGPLANGSATELLHKGSLLSLPESVRAADVLSLPVTALSGNLP